MPIIEYTPVLFGDLKRFVARLLKPVNLIHQPFVDYYYTDNRWCKLFLYYSDSGDVLGTLGRELMRFEYKSREIMIRFGTNWYSLQRGVGTELGKYSVASAPDSIGLMFTGSEDTLAILHHRGWTFISGVRGYFLNNPHPIYRGDSFLRRSAKSFVRSLKRRIIPKFASHIPSHMVSGLSVREEHSYSEDLLAFRSSFAFRFAPTFDYLKWRYSLSLSFARYRLFRVMKRGVSAGYVILNDSPDCLSVAQSDGEEATTLAYGILLSILEIGRSDRHPRNVFLASCHPGMQQVFEEFGFRAPRKEGDMPFAFRTLPPEFDKSPANSNWLVNFDWGDNTLRVPFLDQAAP
jgi:hypothetical protein